MMRTHIETMEFPYGKITPTLPQGCIPYEQWPEFKLEALPQPFCNPVAVGHSPKGVRWSFWPLTFEEYVSDQEPDLSVSDPHDTARYRFIMWRRVTTTRTPKGWWALSRAPSRVEGFIILRPDYWRTWSENARRQRKKWLTQIVHKTYTTETVGLTEFEEAYKKSTVARSTLRESIKIAKQMEAASPGTVTYKVAKRLSDGAIKAGFAYIDSSYAKSSYYAVGFYHKDTQDVPLTLGLIDEWFADAEKKGYRFLHLGQFWRPGESRAWKGFSLFKSKLNPIYIAYPPLLWRFARGKVF